MKRLSKSDMKKLMGALAQKLGCWDRCYYHDENNRLIESICAINASTFGNCMCLGTEHLCYVEIDP